MNRKRRAKQLRRDILRMGGVIKKKEIVKYLFDDIVLPKKEWGYVIEVLANGYTITSVDGNWYDCWKGAWECTKWAFEQEPFVKKEEENDGELLCGNGID